MTIIFPEDWYNKCQAGKPKAGCVILRNRCLRVLYNYTEKNKNAAPDDSAGCSVFGAHDSEVLRKTDRKAVNTILK